MDEQTKVYVCKALKVAHTEVHQALHELNQGSEKAAKRKALSALKKIAEAIASV